MIVRDVPAIFMCIFVHRPKLAIVLFSFFIPAIKNSAVQSYELNQNAGIPQSFFKLIDVYLLLLKYDILWILNKQFQHKLYFFCISDYAKISVHIII